jgi:hypothetical protein
MTNKFKIIMKTFYKKILMTGSIFSLSYITFVIVMILFFYIMSWLGGVKELTPSSENFLITTAILGLYPGILIIKEPDAFLLLFSTNIICYFIFGTIAVLIVDFIKSKVMKPKLELKN